jgi:hypothetical protein
VGDAVIGGVILTGENKKISNYQFVPKRLPLNPALTLEKECPELN